MFSTLALQVWRKALRSQERWTCKGWKQHEPTSRPQVSYRIIYSQWTHGTDICWSHEWLIFYMVNAGKYTMYRDPMEYKFSLHLGFNFLTILQYFYWKDPNINPVQKILQYIYIIQFTKCLPGFPQTWSRTLVKQWYRIKQIHRTTTGNKEILGCPWKLVTSLQVGLYGL